MCIRDSYRITGIDSKCATLGQVTKVLAALPWDCNVYHVAWDPATTSYFALAKAHAAPRNTTIKVQQCSLPWTIAEAPIEEVKPKVPTYNIVDPTAIREPPPSDTTSSPASAAGSLQAKAGRSPHIHDLMHATPKLGKGYAALSASRDKSPTPQPKRQRSGSATPRQRVSPTETKSDAATAAPGPPPDGTDGGLKHDADAGVGQRRAPFAAAVPGDDPEIIIHSSPA